MYLFICHWCQEIGHSSHLDLKRLVTGDVFTADQEGLDNVITYTHEIHRKTGKIPNPQKSDDKTLKLIYNAIYRGAWAKFGIRKRNWSDLKRLVTEK